MALARYEEFYHASQPEQYKMLWPVWKHNLMKIPELRLGRAMDIEIGVLGAHLDPKERKRYWAEMERAAKGDPKPKLRTVAARSEQARSLGMEVEVVSG